MGIRDHPTAPRSPWHNSHVERLISSIRRECLDHFVVFGEAHLRRILKAYAAYYNEVRTHLSLNKDAPGFQPSRPFGAIESLPILGGLHHHNMFGFEFWVGKLVRLTFCASIVIALDKNYIIL